MRARVYRGRPPPDNPSACSIPTARVEGTAARQQAASTSLSDEWPGAASGSERTALSLVAARDSGAPTNGQGSVQRGADGDVAAAARREQVHERAELPGFDEHRPEGAGARQARRARACRIEND